MGCEVDARYAPMYLGGWQVSQATDLRVNNNFGTYSARATAEKLTIDKNEIGDARWFDIAEPNPNSNPDPDPNPNQVRHR